VSGEVHDRGGFDFVEMIEDAGLMPAEQALRLRVADVSRMTI
jgi:hypothetical protein